MRKSALICLIISLARLISGRLIISEEYSGEQIRLGNGKLFTIFRYIKINPFISEKDECVFIVSFKFRRLSHRANKLISLIPMLAITGFPGFMAKIYTVNAQDGYWQGIYQWESSEHLKEYKKSFVFRMMNKRAIPNTIKMKELQNIRILDFIDNHKMDIGNSKSSVRNGFI